MEFKARISDYRPIFDLMQLIYAEGEIHKGDALKFEKFITANKLIPGAHVHFHSNGGILEEGIALGRIIRRNGFATYIDNNDKEKNPVSICASAAALAYLGGLYRYKYGAALYGVHQISIGQSPSNEIDYFSKGQELSSIVIEYIAENNVNSLLFSKMATAKPDDINWLSDDDLELYNIVNNGILLQDWELRLIEDVNTLRGHQIGIRGEHKLIIYMTPSGNVLAMAFFGTAQKKGVLDDCERMALRINEEIFAIPVCDIVEGPKITGDFVTFMFEINSIPWENIVKSSSIGAALLPPNPDIYAGFDMKTTLHHSTISSFFKSAELRRKMKS